MSGLGSDSIRKTATGIIALFIVLAILIAANVILGNLRLRMDLTEEALYTLSEGTRNMLSKLDREVTLKLFSSAGQGYAPAHLKAYAREVDGLLAEYKLAAKENLIIEKHDPQPDSDEEEWARRYGITGQPAEMFGPPLYFGLVAVCANEEFVIPSLDPRTQNLLEYNITRLIYRVAHPEKPVIGVMSSLPVLGSQPPPYAMPGQPRPQPQPPWLAFGNLQQDYALREIDSSAESIDEDLQALILVHPKDLGDATLFAIDQFVLRGGKLLAFLDPMSVVDQNSSPSQNPMMGGMNRKPSNLEPLLKAWGIGYDPNRVLVDYRAASRIPPDSPAILALAQDNMAEADILTTQLESIMVAMSGAFVDNTDDTLTVTPLLRSEEGAGRINAMTAQFGSAAIRKEFTAEAGPLNIAVRLDGTFRSAFPDGAPSDDVAADGEEASDEASPASETLKQGEGNVVLVADADMLYDGLCVQEQRTFFGTAPVAINNNILFLENATELMSGSSDLIGIRSRGKLARPFEKVVEMEEQAEAAGRAQLAASEARLQEIRRQLSDMEGAEQDNQRIILTPEQQGAIMRLRDEELRVNKEIRNIRKNLRRDIRMLGVKIKVINIATMPLIVILSGIGFWSVRRRKR